MISCFHGKNVTVSKITIISTNLHKKSFSSDIFSTYGKDEDMLRDGQLGNSQIVV